MKKILISCFISLITGLCFVGGGFIALNQIKRKKRTNIRLPGSSRKREINGRKYGGPGGKELAHRRGFEAKKGHSYKHSDLQDKDLHKLQHRHEGY